MMHMFFCLKNFDDEYITKNFTKDKDKNKALIFTLAQKHKIN